MLYDYERIAVVGSRDYGVYKDLVDGNWKQDLSLVRDFILSLPDHVTIISGGAKGPDTVAVETAKKRGLAYKVWDAEWRIYGKQAGYIRNHQIVNDCDVLVAFWNGDSKGTRHSIDFADKQGKRVIIIHDGK